MNYALLPFPRSSKKHDGTGLPDIRDALASRKRAVAINAIDNLALLNHVVDSLRELPWRFVTDHCSEKDGQLYLAVIAADLGRNLDVGDKLNAGFFLHNSENAKSETLSVCAHFPCVLRKWGTTRM